VNDKTAASPGIFGKLPSRGDFISRRIPSTFLEPWDQWLQGGISCSKEQLAEQWLDIYITSPIWRFGLSAGVAGQECWAGVMIPSVDRVGRYFPLTLASALPPRTNLFVVMGEAADWFAKAESLLLTCLGEDFDFDAFEHGLAETGALLARCCRDPAPGQVPPAPPSPHNAWHLPLSQPGDLQAAMPDLLSQAVSTVFFAYSLWWTSGSDRVKPSFLICQGLPPTEGFSALMDGNWTRRGWQERSILLSSTRPPMQGQAMP
jgi:type VI secretion system protein ImpM